VPYRSVDPATGEVLKTFTERTDQEIMDALGTADKAFVSWAARPIEERDGIKRSGYGKGTLQFGA
jgi:succinate-semialdehyde dehydrogenase/glutarate-semialdehyde dehydrogenase